MRRVALIVGVSRYDRDPSIRQLQFVDADCTELHGLLKHQCGYHQVQLLRDPTKREVLDSVEELGAALGAGDLFLFYFAGHGVEFDSKHLLLCRPAKLAWLKHFDEVIPIDHLRDITARPGVERVFILDSCRSDLTFTRDAVGTGLRGEQSLRDVVAGRPAAPSPEGSLTILCSCSEGRQALELPGRKQGLFTAALLDVMQNAIGRGQEVRLTDEFQDVLAKRMTDLAHEHGHPWEQRPWVQRCGAAPVLLPGRTSPDAGAAAAPQAASTAPTRAPSQDQLAAPVTPAPVRPPPLMTVPPVVTRPAAGPPKLPVGRAASHLPGELVAFRAKVLAHQLDRVLSHARTGRLQIGSTDAPIPPAEAAAWMRRNLEGMAAVSDWHQCCGSGDLDRELVLYGNCAAPWVAQIDRRFMDINKARTDTQGGPSYDRPTRRLLNLLYNWALVVRDMNRARGYLKPAEAAATAAIDWALLADAVLHVFGDKERARALWQKAVACGTHEWWGLVAGVGLELGESLDKTREYLSRAETSVKGVSDCTNLANCWLDLLGDVDAAQRGARKAIAAAREAMDAIHLESMACRLVDAGCLMVAEEVLGAMAALPEGEVDPTFIKVELAVDWAHLLGREDKGREVLMKTEQAVRRLDQTVLGKMAAGEWLRLAEGWSVLGDAARTLEALKQAATRCGKIEDRQKVAAAAKRLSPDAALLFPAPPRTKGWFG